jgi:hypothetical protein
MQLTTYEILFGVLAIISVGINLFQLYRDRINRQRLGNERTLHETILRGLWKSMHESASSLERLKRKGADGTEVADIIGGAINTQRIEIEEFLKHYYGVDAKQLALPLTQAQVQAESLQLVEGVEAITSTMIDAAENAERYIFCVGGRSRNDRYLAAVSQRVLRGDVRYVRVVTGDHIRHQLHEHIRELSKHVDLGYLREDKYGGIMVTHNMVILALYSSRVPLLDKALKIRGERPASDYRAYVLDLLAASDKPVLLDFISNLCTSCRAKEESPKE